MAEVNEGVKILRDIDKVLGAEETVIWGRAA
jgi:hypothetical protein